MDKAIDLIAGAAFAFGAAVCFFYAIVANDLPWADRLLPMASGSAMAVAAYFYIRKARR